jgi:hypothetical protein
MPILKPTRRTTKVEVNLALVEYIAPITRKSGGNRPVTIQPISVDITYTRTGAGDWEVDWRINGVRILKNGSRSTKGTYSFWWMDLNGVWGSKEPPHWVADAIDANHPDVHANA